jgi:UDP-3-O-[3-hydroxymyristoyl] N-acetylglucosamine deacetylase
MTLAKWKINNNSLQIYGKGLFSKDEVTVLINKGSKGSGIKFRFNNQIIPALVKNVSNSNRNTVLSAGSENICLVEHFLAACSLKGLDGLSVEVNKPELVFGDGSAIHWCEAFEGSDSFVSQENDFKNNRRSLIETIFCKKENKQIVAIPHDGFKVSYFMDWNHPSLGKLFASWQLGDDIKKLLRARSFATKEENDYFGASDRLLTLEEKGFNRPLYEPLEPLYHKILDIIGDLSLSGINPLSINMHVIGFKSGHELNVELSRKINKLFCN